MKAAQISAYGHAEAVIVTEAVEPVPAAGQVLVEVHAASLNPFDTMVREGYLKDSVPLALPVTLGGDIAGIVKAVGADVTHVKPGDRVYGQANAVAGNSGAFAEYAVTAASQVALAPSGLQYTALAALPLVTVSAWQALAKHLELAAGQTVLIRGGAGGIGAAAVELAKHLGAHVTATASGEGVQFAKSLGADEAVDYQTGTVTPPEGGFDALFDTVGGDGFNASLSLVRRGGKAVSMAAQPDAAVAETAGVAAIYQQTSTTTAALDAVRELVEAGVMHVKVAAVYSLEEVSEAFTKRETGHLLGKVVLQIRAHE